MAGLSVESLEDDELEIIAASHLVLNKNLSYALASQLDPEAKELIRAALARIQELEQEVEGLIQETSRQEGSGKKATDSIAAERATLRSRDRTQRRRIEELTAENRMLKAVFQSLKQEIAAKSGQVERLLAKVDDLQEQIRSLIMPKIRRMYKEIA